MEKIISEWIFEQQANSEIGCFEEFEVDPIYSNPANFITYFELSNELQFLLKRVPYSFAGFETALRKSISKRKSQNNEFERLLTLYYKIKCLSSFGIPYSESLQTPGSNILITIPGWKLLQLSTPYHEFGYNFLGCKTKSEIKWFNESWGQPTSHNSMNMKFRKIWDKYESALKLEYAKKNVEIGISLIESVIIADKANLSESDKEMYISKIIFPLGSPHSREESAEIVRRVCAESRYVFKEIQGNYDLIRAELKNENISKGPLVRGSGLVFTFSKLAIDNTKSKVIQ